MLETLTLVVSSSPQGHSSSYLYPLHRDGTTTMRGGCCPWHHTNETTELPALKLACCRMRFLTRGDFALGQGLGTLVIVTTAECARGGRTRACYWHLVGRSQGSCSTSYNAWPHPNQVVIWSKTSTVLLVRNPGAGSKCKGADLELHTLFWASHDLSGSNFQLVK